MSHVRMCDRCRIIFSENDDDWSTFSGVRRNRDPETGRIVNTQIEQDACSNCTNKMMGKGTAIESRTTGEMSYEKHRQLLLDESHE